MSRGKLESIGKVPNPHTVVDRILWRHRRDSKHTSRRLRCLRSRIGYFRISVFHDRKRMQLQGVWRKVEEAGVVVCSAGQMKSGPPAASEALRCLLRIYVQRNER